jgi:hypothetical protein
MLLVGRVRKDTPQDLRDRCPMHRAKARAARRRGPATPPPDARPAPALTDLARAAQALRDEALEAVCAAVAAACEDVRAAIRVALEVR